MSTLVELPLCPVCGYLPSEWESKSDHGSAAGWSIACVSGNTRDHEIWVSKRTRRACRATWRRIAGRAA